MKTTKAQDLAFAELRVRMADEAYDTVLRGAEKWLRHVADDLGSMYGSERWTDGRSDPADVGCSVVNHLTSNILGNLRIDLIAKYSHEAAVARAVLAQAEGRAS
jgi:hypothetical protein